jgi:hypothetical protein
MAALSSAFVGCDSCKNSHPFVPFHIVDGEGAPVGSAEAAAADAAPSQDAALAIHTTALVAPPHATSWALGSLALTAPPGTTFRQGLAWDIDGDGHEDALTLAETEGEHPTLDLYFYRGVASGAPLPSRVALGVEMRAGQPSLPLDARCARIEHLSRVGKRSAAIEVGETCPKELAEQGPDRLVALVTWSNALIPRFALPIVDPPGAGALAVDLDGADIDGDGRDDATLHVSLEGGEPPFEPGPKVEASFRWFDRPAGMSREPGLPEASFHTIASLALGHATKAKEAAKGAALAASGRLLFEAVCAESSARRIAPDSGGSQLACDAGRPLFELGIAAARAYVTLGDPFRAIASLDAAVVPPAVTVPAKVAEASGWITTLAPPEQATTLRAISAVPRLGPAEASWGALQFEPSGELLVRTLAGVVRVDPVRGDEVEAQGVVAWPTKVSSPDGKQRFEGAFRECSKSARDVLEASLVAESGVEAGGDATRVPLPIFAPSGARCPSGTAREPARSLPLAWGPGGLEVVVSGEPLLITGGKASPLAQLLTQPVVPGSPRSPNGGTFVVPTSQGILVKGPKVHLFRAKELEHGYGELRDCTVSDDGARVACTRGGVAFVGVWP